MKNNIITTLFIAACSLVQLSCSVVNKDKATEPETAVVAENSTNVELSAEQIKNAKISVGKAVQKSIGTKIQVNGIIDVPPQNHVSLNTPYGGFVDKITVLPGSMVKKGQLLAVISNPLFIDLQQAYLESLSKKELLKAEFERQETLLKEEVSSNKVYQQAKSDYLLNEATLQANEEKLKFIGFNKAKIKEGKLTASVSLYSTINGSVRDVLSNVGKYIQPQDIILNLTNTDDLHVELTVYENGISSIKVGQEIQFTVANSPNVIRKAKVFLVGSDVRSDRSVTVHGHLKQEYSDLLPGMYVSAEVFTNNDIAYTLPESAIVRFEGKSFAFKALTPTSFEMIEVQPGETENGFTKITLTDATLKTEDINFATSGGFNLLAMLKNIEEEE